MYSVVELKTTNSVTTSEVYTLETENLAYQKYYEILAAAATSKAEIHSAALLNEFGNTLRNDSFDRSPNSPANMMMM